MACWHRSSHQRLTRCGRRTCSVHGEPRWQPKQASIVKRGGEVMPRPFYYSPAPVYSPAARHLAVPVLLLANPAVLDPPLKSQTVKTVRPIFLTESIGKRSCGSEKV